MKSRKDIILYYFILKLLESKPDCKNLILDLNKIREDVIDVDVDILNNMNLNIGVEDSDIPYDILGFMKFNKSVNYIFIICVRYNGSCYTKTVDMKVYNEYKQLFRKKKLNRILYESY